MTTHSSFVRKAFEIPLTYLAELILSKDRRLDLYLNVIEWGQGVYGADPAARHYYGVPASRLSRYQAATLAAVIPSPRKRSPQRMGWYTSIILRRMVQLGY
jgi:monofunctional biosynthetic peptidoglycan transglycosylase